jgi:hypothetical protein
MSKNVSPLALGAAFSTLPATLVMHNETSPYVLSQIIREARNFVRHGVQVSTFSIEPVKADV